VFCTSISTAICWSKFNLRGLAFNWNLKPNSYQHEKTKIQAAMFSKMEKRASNALKQQVKRQESKAAKT
jgi:hypothetical protein